MNNEPNISVYGDGAGEDFPVLKAFQQYIDAEQAKARRRLLTVSVIFVVTLIAVIAIFSVMVIKANDKTQSLNDRMVEMLMRDSERKVEEARNAAMQEVTVKSLNETLERLQKRIEEQDRKTAEAAAASARELSSAATVDPSAEQRHQEAEAKLQKALALLKAEKQKLAKEKERLRQEELERYRREHYPQYYAKKEAAERARLRAELKLDDLDDDPEDAVIYFEEEEPSPSSSGKRPKKSAPVESDDDAIEYFNEDDSYTIPVEVKGKRAGWRVPLD